MFRPSLLASSLAVLAATALGSVAAPVAAQGSKLDQLEQNLTQEFQRQFVGYSIAIARHGRVQRTLVSGLARREADGRKALKYLNKQFCPHVLHTLPQLHSFPRNFNLCNLF